MTDRKGEISEAVVESLRSRENRELSDWRRLWEADREFTIVSHRGWLGRVIVLAKRLLRGLVKAPQADLWQRQRAYNLTVQDQIEAIAPLAAEAEALSKTLARARTELSSGIAVLGQDLQTIQSELVRDLRETREKQTEELVAVHKAAGRDIKNLERQHSDFLRSHADRLDHLEGFHNRGYDEVMDHTAALFSQLDQKLDRYRELSRERWGRLGGLLAVAEGEGATKKPELARAIADEKYLEFEDRFRGREEDIAHRLEPYLGVLSGRGEVLDLGCGRGEALEVMTAHGIRCSGVDSNVEMVDRCREKGFEAEVGDLFTALEARSEASLGGIVSFHVIEHLPAAELERLSRLAWRVLAPAGVLVLETPNPVSMVVGASRFWIDPTHKRPVHPESLKTMLELSGFDPVERIDLQPFADEDRLPQIPSDGIGVELLPLVARINLLRDRLDDLLFGFQDYALVAYKPPVGKPA
ncbi:MAG: class I SAM-dependent methyltransferase [bacterium]|nr:class I SAM-dependent methyltransferase [bacterium]